MSTKRPIRASLSIDALASSAREAFDLAAAARYHGIAFATNHAELKPEDLGDTARRHLKKILSSKHLGIDAIRIAAPRAGLADPATIDRTIENARKGILLAADLGVQTVALNLGNLGDAKVPADTIVAALRELAQHADAAGHGGVTLAFGADVVEPLGNLLKQVDYDRAQFNLDTARLISSGEDALTIAEGFAGRIGQVTATDAVRAGHTLRATFLGEGQLALPELMEILQEQDYRGPTIVDVRDLADPVAGAHHAAEVLAKLIR